VDGWTDVLKPPKNPRSLGRPISKSPDEVHSAVTLSNNHAIKHRGKEGRFPRLMAPKKNTIMEKVSLSTRHSPATPDS
jgi:hypothetical protein